LVKRLTSIIRVEFIQVASVAPHNRVCNNTSRDKYGGEYRFVGGQLKRSKKAVAQIGVR